ncbi:MAG: hypothetical protein HY880_00995 [Deltaproteobacteria bacterium]|nr:hypothetical protein [Deltaproteobacteria bacterium]
MKNYRVKLNGKNFKMELEGKIEKLGFYAARWVQADNIQEAEIKAVNLVREDKSLGAAIRNEMSDSPMIYIDSLTEIDNFDGIDVPGTGYSFYLDEVTKETQGCS